MSPAHDPDHDLAAARPFRGGIPPADLSAQRLLYIPNEHEEGDQAGPRASYEALNGRRELDAYEPFPISVLAREVGTATALGNLLDVARRMQPTLILWQHPGALDVPAGFLRALSEVPSRPLLLYHEGDIYGWVRKRLPRGARRLARAADLVFTVGLGSHARRLRLAGARHVVYAPHCADPTRFGKPWTPTTSRRYDVVMIANRVTARWHPFEAFPGARAREQLATGLGDMLGKRFALFGSGWDGFTGARGPLAFDEQEQACRDARLTVSWDHFDRVDYYFSNRVPISLVSGVAHVTNRQPGYGELFADGRELFLVDGVDAALARVRDLLDGLRSRLEEVGARGAAFAGRYLTDDVVYRALLDIAVGYRRGESLAEPADWVRAPEPGGR